MKNIVKIFLCSLIFTSLVNAQQFKQEKLDSLFSTLEENNVFFGNVGIAKNGKIIYEKSLGYSDFENKVKNTQNTNFRIGSITKTFTSTLVFKAIEENKLNLNITLDKWFPEIKNAEKITISNLLNHRSGIYNFTNNPDYFKWNTNPKTETEMIEIIKKGGSEFEPNEKENYSNSNYLLLSFILEKIYKKPYHKILEQKITKPLNLKNTLVYSQINPQNNDAKSYNFLGNWKLDVETDSSIPLGAGAIKSTLQDLLKFSQALFNEKIISKNSILKMKETIGEFGYGLFKYQYNDKINYGHTGGIDGFKSIFTHSDEDNISIAILSNGSNYNLNTISLNMYKAIHNLPYDIPRFSNYQHSSEELKNFVGIYKSNDIPLKVTITLENNSLIGQATGQSAFQLEAMEKNIFKFELAGLKFNFDPTTNSMDLIQGGKTYHFIKE